MSDTDLSGLAPIYARLAQSIAADLVRLKGMDKEEAEVVALQMTLDGARDLIIGIREMDEEWDAKKRKRLEAKLPPG